MSNSSNRSIQTKHIADIAHQRNYISNNAAIRNTQDFVVSKNTVAAARPDSGFVTSATNITFTRTTSSPLSGDASFLITKDAANRQGEQVYVPFTVDSADQAKMMTLSFDYAVDSGTFVFSDGKTTDSDIIAYIYDVTNAKFIEPIGFRLTNNSDAKMSFQTAANSTSYRLLLHVATTSASAYTLKVDNICITRQVLASDSLITNEESYTPTFQGFGTPTSISAFWSRLGDKIRIHGYFTTGTVTASEARISLPNNLIVDSTKLAGLQIVGNFGSQINTAQTFYTLAEPGVSYITTSTQSAGSNSLTKAFGSGVAGSSQLVSFEATVPIQGWETNTTVLSSGEGRVVAASITHTSNLSVTGGSAIVPTSILKDTHGAYNSSTGQFTCPVAGIYKVTAGGITSTGQRTLKIYKNGSYHMAIVSVNTSAVLGGEYQVDCKAGDILTVVPDSSDTLIYSATNYQMYLSFERISGPEQVQAGEKILASYYKDTANQSITGSATVVIFNTKDIDTHGAYNTSTGKFTAPRSGYVRVSGQITTTPSGGYYDLYIYKNGSTLIGAVRTANNTSAATICTSIPLKAYSVNAGDTIEIQVSGAGWTIDATNSNVWNNITFEMI